MFLGDRVCLRAIVRCRLKGRSGRLWQWACGLPPLTHCLLTMASMVEEGPPSPGLESSSDHDAADGEGSLLLGAAQALADSSTEESDHGLELEEEGGPDVFDMGGFVDDSGGRSSGDEEGLLPMDDSGGRSSGDEEGLLPMSALGSGESRASWRPGVDLGMWSSKQSPGLGPDAQMLLTNFCLQCRRIPKKVRQQLLTFLDVEFNGFLAGCTHARTHTPTHQAPSVAIDVQVMALAGSSSSGGAGPPGEPPQRPGPGSQAPLEVYGHLSGHVCDYPQRRCIGGTRLSKRTGGGQTRISTTRKAHRETWRPTPALAMKLWRSAGIALAVRRSLLAFERDVARCASAHVSVGDGLHSRLCT